MFLCWIFFFFLRLAHLWRRNNAPESDDYNAKDININMYMAMMMATTAMAVAAENNKLILCDGHTALTINMGSRGQLRQRKNIILYEEEKKKRKSKKEH